MAIFPSLRALPPVPPPQPDADGAPVRRVTLPITPPGDEKKSIVLRGLHPRETLEFGMRRDEIAVNAVLNLEYTPSPALIPALSQLKVYLNDELMGSLPITRAQLGKKTAVQLALDPLFITDRNQLRFEFIGHYRDVCENPTNSTLWLDIGRHSQLILDFKKLAIRDDLAWFPLPFFDARDDRRLELPMIFAAAPDLPQQRAAAMLASWFGAQAGWRGQHFPVRYDQLPEQHSIVFATNAQRPAFLRDYPPVDAPTLAMVHREDKPWVKMLLILGRDDNDLLQAVRAIVEGHPLLRGDRAVIKAVKALAPRQPYDAPNWIRTDRPVTFAELQSWEGQLQSVGLEPASIDLDVNLPPDLWLPRQDGIDMRLGFRYTSPPARDSSRMDIHLNDQFLHAFNLLPQQAHSQLMVRLPVLQGLLDKKADVALPALRLGATNHLRFDFQYMNPLPGGSLDNCITYQPVQNKVVLDGDSTLDLTHYYHFIAMPDLRAFASAGFPFSRMADLADTLILVPRQAPPAQLTALLDTLGAIGANTGLAASRFTLSDDPRQMQQRDADILLIGTLPAQLKDEKRVNSLVQSTLSWVKTPVRLHSVPAILPDAHDRTPQTQTTLTADGPMAAIVGFQSPYHKQRSVIALLADSARGYALLDDALIDSGKRAAIFGSVTLIRDSGVEGIRVGGIYYVGHLPWQERLWFALSGHPVLLACLATLSIVLLAWVLWRLLRLHSRRRLRGE